MALSGVDAPADHCTLIIYLLIGAHILCFTSMTEIHAPTRHASHQSAPSVGYIADVGGTNTNLEALKAEGGSNMRMNVETHLR